MAEERLDLGLDLRVGFGGVGRWGPGGKLVGGEVEGEVGLGRCGVALNCVTFWVGVRV